MAFEEEQKVGAPEWITTFSDMVSLLVTFFILIFTFSSIEAYDVFTFKQNILGTRGTVQQRAGSSAVAPPSNDAMFAKDVEHGARSPHTRPPDRLPVDLEEMGQKLTEGRIELDPKDVRDGISIRFDDRGAFAPGSTSVSPVLRAALEELADVMQHYPHRLVIEGFTDSEFKPSPRFPTAEALSCARARAAAEVLLESSTLARERLQVAGLATARPLNAGRTPLERTVNRRVEVRILALSAEAAVELERAR